MACVIAGFYAAPAFAVIDDELTGSVWKVKYGVTATQWSDANWLLADSDGDGMSNGSELGFGTNPFISGEVVKITEITVGTTNANLTFPTLLGKKYVMQGSATLSGFADLSPAVNTMGNGSPKTLAGPKGSFKFFRVLVQDIDTDGDGVSDWAELQTGLNISSATTSPGVNDHDFIAPQFTAAYQIDIMAVNPFASEDGPTAGTFEVTRTNKLNALTVTLNTSGTAFGGTDYNEVLPATVVFAAGEDKKTLTVTPKQDAPTNVVEGSKSVISALSLTGVLSAFPVALGANPSATVIIGDTTDATGTGLLARYYDTASSTYVDGANFGQVGTFTYSRTGSTPYTASTILVPFTYNGSPALQVGHLVRLSFTSGSLDGTTFDNVNYSVTAVTPGVSFTVGISGAALPTSYNPTGNFSIQSFPHPAVIQRVDATVNNDWVYGTPNDVAVTPNNPVDNYSTFFEGYLHPTTTGNYQFQLDADDKARVLIDLNTDGDFLDVGEQVIEHGWDTADGILTPEVVGTFKQSAVIPLVVPGTPATRYKIRVEHLETTGDARCRLQWRLGSAGYANIPQANVFSHTRAVTNYTVTSSVATINTAVVHGLTAGVSTVTLHFTAGTLFTPPANYSGTYTVQTTPTTTSFTINVPGAANQTATNGLMVDSTSTTTGWLNQVYTNTTFTAPAGNVGVVAAGATNSNNGIWGSGTPDPTLIGKDTFSVRWTGQVQPQFSEDYTFAVTADDGCSLWINGQLQTLKMLPSASTGGSTYSYDATTGNVTVTYSGLAAVANSFVAGETVRMDFSTGNLNHAPTTPPTYDYDPTNGDVVVNYSNVIVGAAGGTRVAGSYNIGDTVELDPTSGGISPLGTLPYTITAIDAPNNKFTFNTGALTFTPTFNIASIAATSPCTITTTTNHGLASGARVRITGVTGGTFSAPINDFYTITVTGLNTFTVGSNCTAAATAGTGKINASGNITINDTRNAQILASPAPTATSFTVNVGTSKYANASAGNVNLDIVNKSLKEWSSNGSERFVRIPMLGGTRYDIQLDYYDNTGNAKCQLAWFSASQPKQIIPAERLYPSSVTQAPPSHIAPTTGTALVGGQYSYLVGGSNGGTVSVTGLPPGLTYNSATSLITGNATTPGDYQVIITITNAAGTSTSVLNLHVENTGGTIAREYWNSVVGTTVANLNDVIEAGTAPTGTANLTTLEAPTNFGDSYGARIRGYITAPTTGNYYFWIAASNAAELWISNDDEPVNIFKRASVIAGNATPKTWGSEANQKSAWLALEQGKKYYIEILHKAGVGSGDNLAVGWDKPIDTDTTAPSEVVPSYVLSPYVAPVAGPTSGTLYLSTMLSQNGAVTNGVGSSTLLLSPDENTAYMKRSYAGLTGPITSEHIHTDPYLAHASTIVFDIDAPVTPGDGLITNTSDPNYTGTNPQTGTYKWTILPVGTLSKADIIEIIKQGKAYVNLHTTMYLAGEIRGNYTLANGTRTFTPPPAPQAWADDSNSNDGAARFLAQATFGANIADITALQALSPAGTTTNSRYEKWIDNQFLIPSSQHLPEVLAREMAEVFGPFDVKLAFNTWWKTSLTAPDQLRQRIAYAFSQIHVVSGQGPLEDNSRALSYFYDQLATNAFGNFKDILTDTTLTPTMGRYLDMLGNDKPDLSLGRSPNENYAREIKQLFSIGLYRMWPDGTLMLTSKDSPIDTYTQREIVGLAHVFTGWYYGYDGVDRTGFNAAADWTRQMRVVPVRHFTGQKRLLNNEILPGLSAVGGVPLDPYANHLSTQFNEQAYKDLPTQELNAAHEMMHNHPNTGPFICRQLIQRMVTSNPSRDYLYRVVQKFNDNGAGVRGDMKAVIKAILLDYEARSPALLAIPAYGKQREPIQRVTNAVRALRSANVTGSYSQSVAQLNSTGVPYILITTSTPHLLSTGNSVFLEFTDTTLDPAKPAPSTGTYTVLSNPAPTSTTYAIAAPGWLTGTYSQSGTTITVTMSGHYLPGDNANVFGGAQVLAPANEGRAYFDFTSGGLNTLAGIDQTVQQVVTTTSYDIPSGVGNTKTLPTVDGNYSGSTFTITAPDSATRSGNVMIARFGGGYSCTGRAGTITIDTSYNGAGTFGAMADHHLSAGDNVFLNFTNSRDTTSGAETSTENDLLYTIGGVPDANTFTVQARDAINAAMNSDNQVVIFPLKAQPLVRVGTINARPSTYTMDNTDTDLQQTPLNATTVFNYFLPDYKFAGTLASQGITTPEFQLTSETTVIRQANFLYSGIFNPSSTTGISSFKAGTNALVLDFSPWLTVTAPNLGLGVAPTPGVPWTHNQNLSTLIDQLSTLFSAGQISATSKAVIKNFVATPIASIGLHASACVVTTTVPHKLVTGDTVLISGVTGGTFAGTSGALNNTTTTRVVTVTGLTDGTSTTFTIPLACTVIPTSLTNAHVSVIPYNQGATSDVTNKRDRLRSIIHLILTSPDYTIQR